LNFNELTGEFIQAVDQHAGAANLTKFLCGIYTPMFAKLKVKAMPNFGALEQYPFPDVKKWVSINLS
jgi:ATP-dependent DNA helicase RecQ